jgi:hypothetical protein
VASYSVIYGTRRQRINFNKTYLLNCDLWKSENICIVIAYQVILRLVLHGNLNIVKTDRCDAI